MFMYELRKWLLKIYAKDDFKEEVVETHMNYIRQLMPLREDIEELVADDLLSAAIEISHISGGKDGLMAFAQHMRGMADAIEVRVRRGTLRVTPKANKPANQD